ncbi:hypothetical protein [Halorubrum sp. AS12]|uniref:hypothetical protein n=1 Tax=Halorubrum sp. AS12 TaxID=3409687 RepID=UPI003DA77422
MARGTLPAIFVEAQWSVSLETADDSDTLLAFEIIDDEYVSQSGGRRDERDTDTILETGEEVEHPDYVIPGGSTAADTIETFSCGPFGTGCCLSR